MGAIVLIYIYRILNFLSGCLMGTGSIGKSGLVIGAEKWMALFHACTVQINIQNQS